MNSAVIVAGGRGIRLGLDLPKQFHELCGREIISYSVETFLNHPEIHEVIIVTPYDWVDHVTQIYPKCKAVEGGTKRQDSSLNGVLATNIESENILIHDAVRPFVTARVISDCLNSLEKSHVSAPIMDSTNSLIVLSFSGLPKFKQFVIATGLAPTEIKFLQLSQTICLPPVKG